MINTTSISSWSKSYEMQIMLNKIGVVCQLLDNGNYSSAYDKLLFDIKPKLTGSKTDENGTAWGDGTFKNPWIVDPALRLDICRVIDYALADIKSCSD